MPRRIAKNVLTMGDGKGFARMGGIVALVARGNAFQVAMNPRAAEGAQLRIGAKLMQIGEMVADEDLKGKMP
jgi:hypothetical protein